MMIITQRMNPCMPLVLLAFQGIRGRRYAKAVKARKDQLAATNKKMKLGMSEQVSNFTDYVMTGQSSEC